MQTTKSYVSYFGKFVQCYSPFINRLADDYTLTSHLLQPRDVIHPTDPATGNEIQLGELADNILIQLQRRPLQQPVFTNIRTKDLPNSFLNKLADEIINPAIRRLQPSADRDFLIFHIRPQQE